MKKSISFILGLLAGVFTAAIITYIFFLITFNN
ncbi:hypothetical protein SAMN05444267_104011 [Chryseobacterium polytrichastri]|uniref:Uncharacterized protein n=1 Tax=Chryseobacterium polytrichastri TaxID=1302687 RepID=A0A1M7HCK7_9FLAO|nr:hypothetical protein SAMN05444267_104011 [Chryseobacterium polytrichastri]